MLTAANSEKRNVLLANSLPPRRKNNLNTMHSLQSATADVAQNIPI